MNRQLPEVFSIDYADAAAGFVCSFRAAGGRYRHRVEVGALRNCIQRKKDAKDKEGFFHNRFFRPRKGRK